MLEPDDNPILYLLAALVAGIGALNWGAREYLDTDLLVDTLGIDTGTGTYSLLLGVIGIAGLLTIYGEVWWYQRDM